MERVKQFIKEKYRKGNYVFLSVLVRNLDMTTANAKECCEQLVAEGMLQKIYAVSHGCGHSEDIVHRYASMEEIPEFTYCDVCMCEYDPKKNIEIEYKVN